VAEAEAAEEEGGKKSKKKLIMMVVGLLVIGLLAAKMTVLKPPPLTPKQKADKATAAKYTLESLCAAANELPPPPMPKPSEGAPAPTTTTTVKGEEMPVIGPVLTVDSTTLNLADGHFLKIGLALQLPAGSVAEEVGKTENWGAITGQVVLNTFSNEDMADILPTKQREKLRHEVGNDVCVKSEGKATTVYFTEFVAQ